MWKFIKNLINKYVFTKEQENNSKDRLFKMNLGDLKKLKEGKIKDIYPPYI